jgi:hypothetical protein
MRVLIIILTLVISTSSSAQTFYPFQVLYAENTKLSSGKELKSLDMVSDKETIKISEGGYLVLIHETGIPVELTGDTTALLNEIHSILDPPLSEKTRKKITKGKVSNIRHSYQRTAGLSYLFITNPVEARKTQLNLTGACSDCSPNNGIEYPPLIDRRIYFDDEVKITWNTRHLTNKPEPLTEFVVRFKNLFDDEVKSIKVVGKELILPKSEMIELFKEEPNIIFYVTDSYQQGLPDGVIISPFYTKAFQFPYSAKIKTPAAALMAGYFFELASWEASEEAKSYYELATRLSDNKFYKEMLANYHKRQEQ